jgi:PadR family transcriptional regulator, regulatory protein PadR
MAKSDYPRVTIQMLAILRAMLDRPLEERYGFELLAITGIQSGTLYPALMRLERVGWLQSHWEEIDERREKRPRRRLYRLTAEGEPAARKAIAKAKREDGLAGRFVGAPPIPAKGEGA